jgi:hypothetical protein
MTRKKRDDILMNIKTNTFLSNGLIINKKRLCIIFTVLFGIVISLFMGSPKTNTTIFSALKKFNCYSSYSVSQMNAQGYLYNDGFYISLHNDPGFTSDLIDQFLYDITLSFITPLPQDTLIDVFYVSNNEEFSSNQEVICRAYKGDKEITVPLNKYISRFRLDIGNCKEQTIPEFEIYFNRPNFKREIFNFLKNLLVFLIAPLIIYKFWPDIERVIHNNFDKNKALVFLLLIIIILVFLKVNDSNMMVYHDIFPNNIAATDPVVLGTPRPVRSDEWGCDLTADLYRMQQKNKGVQSFSEAVVFYINPQNWGYLFLPIDMGFSWARLLPYFVSSIAIYYFFQIFMKESILYPLLATIVLLWSPGIMWWNSLKIYMHFFLVYDLIYFFFHTNLRWQKSLCCIGLLFSLGTIIVTVYPAWHIPLVYFGVFLLAGAFLQEKRMNFQKTDIIFISVTCVFLLGFILCYFISQKDFISSVANTVYPGKRESIGGDIPLRYFAHYLLTPILPFRDITFFNNSEVSSFISLFPLPVLIYLYKKNDLKKYNLLNLILVFICICAIYMVIGIPLFLSRLTLWSYSFPARISTLFGLSCLILLILEVYYLQKSTEEKDVTSCLQKHISFYILILLFFFYIYIKQKDIVGYLGLPLFYTLAIGVVMLGYISLRGNIKILLIVLSIITIVSGVTVNPLVFGTDIMLKTPIAEVIQTINEKDSGNWITVDGDIWKAKYLRAQGVECLNALSYPPRFDLFSPLDPTGENIDIYNRYAHVNINLSTEKSTFSLVQADHFHVDLNIDDMKKWNVKYVLTTNQLELDTNVLSSELVYTDELDGNYIYKINYK